MRYNDKLREYFKNRGISQKEVADKLGHAPAMISRFLKGTSDFKPEFLIGLLKHYPEIDLQYIFSDDGDGELLMLEDETAIYEKSENINVVKEIEIIEEKLSVLKDYLAQNCHNKN